LSKRNQAVIVETTPPESRQAAQTATGTPEEIRRSIAGIALGHEGSTAWSYDTSHGQYGTNSYKCNSFVTDVLAEAGVPVGNLHDTFRHETVPTAGDWADRDFQIPGWIALPPGTTPQPGDIVAEKHWYSIRATGHVGIIVTDKDGSIKSASASSNQNKVVLDAWGAISDEKITVRRYVGVAT